MIEFFISDHCKNEINMHKASCQTTRWELRKRLWWKVQDIRNLTRSVCLSNMPCSWHWEVTSAPSPLCRTSPARRLTLLENCFSFTRVPSTTAGLISVLQRAPAEVFTWHITRLMLVCNTHSSHCTVAEDVCEQRWLLMHPLATYGGWPMAAAFALGFPDLSPTN